MRSLGDWLFLPMFENRISIRVERDLVTFTKSSKSLCLCPFIYLNTASIILSVGELPPDTRDSIRIDLFQELQSPIDYGDALDAFLRHGINSLLRGRLFQPRPCIDFTISPDVVAFLRRYHKAIFRNAAIHAGVISVTFTS